MAEIGLGLTDIARRGARLVAPGVAKSRPRVAVLRLGEAAAIVGEWSTLANRAAEDNQFFHPDFLVPAATRLGEDVRVAFIRDSDGRLIAAAPVTETRLGRIAPAMRVWSHDYGPLGVPLFDRDATDGAVGAFVEQVAPAGASLILPDLPLDGEVAAVFHRLAARAGRPVAEVGRHHRAMLDRDRPADLRAAQPARRRKEYGRQMRRLADLGEVIVESATEPGKVRARFEEFLILEAAGWKGRNGTALVSSEATLRFARDMIRARAASGAVRVDSIRLDRRPIAMLVSFVSGASAWTWKIAYAEDFARFSPGAQLMLELPARIFAGRAVRRIDSLAAADHPMIDHLWPGRLAIGTLVIGPPGGGVLHRLGLAALRAEGRARKLAHRIRARLKARGKDREKD